jgi:hypothetical protein
MLSADIARMNSDDNSSLILPVRVEDHERSIIPDLPLVDDAANEEKEPICDAKLHLCVRGPQSQQWKWRIRKAVLYELHAVRCVSER